MSDDTPSPLNNVITIDDERIRSHLDRVVRGTVEETLNALLDAEADRLCNAQRYERSAARRDTRAGYYERGLQTKAGEVRLKVPKLRQQTFETAIIERYRRRESSVEEALIEMYLAAVSVRRVEDITEVQGVELIASDACMGLVESAAEFYPEARWQRCMVHFYRNVFSHVPAGKLREVALLLKAIHAQEDLEAAQRKAGDVVARLHSMRLGKAAELVETAVPETLAYYAFPEEHWRRIRTNNPLERIMREIRRRTRVVGAFPDGNSAINLAAARLRHIAGTRWSTKRYLDMKLLKQRNALIA